MRKTVYKLEKVMKPIYKRILLKLSGEGLMGDKNFGMSAEVIQRLAVVVARKNNLRNMMVCQNWLLISWLINSSIRAPMHLSVPCRI